MSSLFARSIQALFGLTLILTWSAPPILAQPFDPTETSVEAIPSQEQPKDPPAETPVEGNPDPNQPADPPTATPTDEKPARKPPRKLKNFVGVGGSIGISGNETGLSEGAAALINNRELNDSLSIRSVTVFGSKRTDRSVALTVNFPIRSKSKQIRLVPYVGGGALISSKGFLDDIIVRGLVTGGIDIPISRRFSATTSVNVGFADEPQVGVQIGFGIKF
jgi:hypothetical protein